MHSLETIVAMNNAIEPNPDKYAPVLKLNIGDRTFFGRFVLESYVSGLLDSILGETGYTFHHHSRGPDIEGTYVVCVYVRMSDAQLERVSHMLGQECIAVLDCMSGIGRLVGPQADKWGPFNPAMFIG